MRLLALAAPAAALASVMALTVGAANAQQSRSDFYELACIDSKGLCYTDDAATNPLPADDIIGYRGERFVNLYRPPLRQRLPRRRRLRFAGARAVRHRAC